MGVQMITMVESGRLGNQIFQYLALRSVAAPGEKIILFGFDQLRDTFDGVSAAFVHIETNPLKHLASINYDKFQRIAAQLPGVGFIREDQCARASREPASRLAITLPSWFQYEQVPDSLDLGKLELKPHHVEAAQRFLSSKGFNGASTAFVQVRAGDYRTWPTPEHPAILPPSWYRERVQELRVRNPDLAIVAVGDDDSYTQEVISEIPNSVRYDADFAAEFALMTLCAAGVLSASSFAFWGAYFAKRNHPRGIFLGPKFWAGHSRGDWWPEQIEANFIDYY